MVAALALGVVFADADDPSGAREEPEGMALADLEAMAAEDNAMAQDILGLRYASGQGVPQDWNKAYTWFHRAALQGYATSQYNLALLYYRGQGTEKNLPEAARWFEKAAGQSHPAAQYMLGELYETGHGVPQSERLAFTWYKKSAAMNYTPAQFKLGLMYQYGKYVGPDPAQAAEWYRRAAEHGNPQAQVALGNLYDAGIGVPKDDAMAIQWYRRAAIQGHPAAQNNLAVKLTPSLSGNPHANIIAAYKWYNLAAAQGVDFAARSRDRLKRRMTEDQIRRAERESVEFIPIPETKNPIPAQIPPATTGKRKVE